MGAQVRFEGTVALEGGERHPHAARRLRASFPMVTWVDAADAPAGVPTVRLGLDGSRAEGAFALRVRQTVEAPEIEVAGGPFSGVIYGVEELIQYQATKDARGFDVAEGRVEQSPSLAYRTFWNWDHSTNWYLHQTGMQEIGVMNPYGKPEDGFLRDFKACVDFMSMHRIAAVVIYGFFRESHGGIPAAQELCRYANERGVRILPGVANLAYGGIVWEMDHPYNVATWLRKNPHLAASMERPVGFQVPGLDHKLYFPRSEYSATGCPSKKENQDWMAEGIAWLAETCDIGGINIEAGDYGVCGCADCTARRAAREDAQRRDGYAESWSHADMADFYPRLFEAALSKRPDLWLYSELQWDNLLDRTAHGDFLRALPEGGIYQHTVNHPYWPEVQTNLTRDYVDHLPTMQNVFRCQFASQWNGDARTERDFFNGRVFHDMAKKADQVGMQGLTVWGEASPYNAATELGYLAFGRFSYDTSLTWDQWLDQDVAPRLGGRNAANRFLALTTELDGQRNLDKDRLRAMRDEAMDGARQPDDEVSRRWTSLLDRVSRRLYQE